MAQSAISEVQYDERRPVNEIRKNNIRNILSKSQKRYNFIASGTL